MYSGFDRSEGTIFYKYRIQGIPAYVLIDNKGKIIGRYLNADNENRGLSDLENKLKELLK